MKRLLLAICTLSMGSPVWAQSAPPLASAQNFAVLGASTVTNTGPTIITGDLGVSPGTAVTGFPPGSVTGGTVHAGHATATAAQAAAHTAYGNLVAFKIGSALTTASNSSVVLANGATAAKVFWQVTSSATLGTKTAFEGNILANISDTLTNGASVTGRVFALTGGVTLTGNRIRTASR